MKKTLFLLATVALAASAQAAVIVTFADQNAPSWSTHNIGTLHGYPTSAGPNTTEYSITEDVKLSMQITGGRLWNYDDATSSWTNSAALSEMNGTLGTSLSSDDLLGLRYAASGAGGAKCYLSFNFDNTVSVGDNVVFYFLVAASAQDQTNQYNSFSYSGLSNATMSYATSTGDGFSDGTIALPNNTYGLIRVEGEIENLSEVKFTTEVPKNGWAMAAYEVMPVPEPATASLSLLGLAALMMRRRRA